MGDISADCVIDGNASGNINEVWIQTPNTADTADTIVIDLSDYGIVNVFEVRGQVQTTENSVLVDEAPTTAVSTGDLTITIGGSTVSNKKRVYVVRGRGAK